MAKCYNCGNSFDYDKYYGICPKCSAYNKEKLPEEEHQEFHEQYDQDRECSNLNGQEYHSMPGNGGYSGYCGPYRQPAGQGERPKSSGASIAVFILLILGIVAAIGMPVVYLVGQSMGLGIQLIKDVGGAASEWNEDDWASLDEGWEEEPEQEIEQIRQSVEVTEAGIHDTCVFGKYEKMIVTVTGQPYVKVPAGQLGGAPKGQNLVAIPVSYLNENEEYHDFYPVGTIYIGYGEQIYRETLGSYDLEEYQQELGETEIVDGYSICEEENGQGELLVFLPEEITGFSLYLESRDEDTYQMLGLYGIPLEIQNQN